MNGSMDGNANESIYPKMFAPSIMGWCCSNTVRLSPKSGKVRVMPSMY
jgi:hypothetical protein